MSESQYDFLIKGREPNDGLAVELGEHETDAGVKRLTVSIIHRSGGELQVVAAGQKGEPDLMSVAVWASNDTHHGRAEQRRVAFVADGICRYFNLGGTGVSAGGTSAIQDVVRVLDRFFTGRRLLNMSTYGYELANSELNTDNLWEHTWTRPDSPVRVIWVEQSFWDVQGGDT